MVSFGKFSWMSGILVGTLILPRGLGAGTLSKRVGESTNGVAAVGALPLGFQVKLGIVRVAEASYVSFSSLGAFRAAVVRAA